MEFKVNKRYVLIMLYIAVSSLTIFCIELIFYRESFSSGHYAWIGSALLSYIVYAYLKIYNAVSIKNGVIAVAGPIGNKINISEITSITKKDDDEVYIIKSDKQVLVIDTLTIESKSLPALIEILEDIEKRVENKN